jgi:hypothetical protein
MGGDCGKGVGRLRWPLRGAWKVKGLWGVVLDAAATGVGLAG